MTTLAICNLLLQGTFTPNSIRKHLMSKDIKSKEIYNYARVCARMVRNAEGVYTPAILEVMNLLSRDDFSRKLPKTYQQMLRCMIGWMKCQEFGSNFNLFVNWSSFDPDVPDVWYTPQVYVEGNSKKSILQYILMYKRGRFRSLISTSVIFLVPYSGKVKILVLIFCQLVIRKNGNWKNDNLMDFLDQFLTVCNGFWFR